MSEESQREPSHRDRVIIILAFLSSKSCREACYQILAPERVAYEWCRAWFDEIYVPSMRYLDGIKGDRSEAAVAEFRSCFSEDELDELERFHRFLELRIEMLSEEAHRRETFPQNDAWDSIVRHTGYLLEDLDGVDPNTARSEVSLVVDRLIRESEQSAKPTEGAVLSSLEPVLHGSLLPK